MYVFHDLTLSSRYDDDYHFYRPEPLNHVQPNIIKVNYALYESEYFFAHTLPPATINSNGWQHYKCYCQPFY